MSYSYTSKGWNGDRAARERRKADEQRDREAVRERRDRHRKALADRLKAARLAAIQRRQQLPLIVPDPVPPAVREQLTDIRNASGRYGTAAEQRAAQDRRDRDRAPLVSPELNEVTLTIRPDLSGFDR